MFNLKKSLMKQKLLKTLALGLLLTGGVNGAWAGDFIDDAKSITIKHSGASSASDITPEETVEGKKVLKFTPTTTGDAYIEFSFTAKAITPGQAFGIIEITNGAETNNKNRFRYLTLDENALEEKSAGSNAYLTIDSKKVILCNFLQNGNDTENKNMPKYYAANVDKESFNVTKVGIYVAIGTANTETTISYVGVHTLGEILAKYSGFCTSKDWQYVSISSPRIEANVSGGNTIKIKDTSGGTATMAQIKLFAKTLGLENMPAAYTTLNFGNLTPSESTSLTTDVFANAGSRTLKMKHEYMHLIPTMAAKLEDSNNTIFYRYLDGVNPSSVTPSPNSSGQWAVYSRELKAGYNSCAMPFKKIANASDVPAGITFYKVSTLSGGRIVFDKISDPTADNCFTTGTDWTPVIIHAETAGVYTFVGRDGNITGNLTGYKAKKVGASGDEPNCIYWVGSFVDGVPTGDYASSKNYGISSDGTKFLKMVADTKTTYYRAFIADKRTAGAPALTLSFDNGNGTTDIVQLKDVHGLTQEDGAVYNLQGVRMTGSNLPAGIYVKNGKKYVVK